MLKAVTVHIARDIFQLYLKITLIFNDVLGNCIIKKHSASYIYYTYVCFCCEFKLIAYSF